ncbi:MAG TPA: aminotransferase class I/II-fold pyridoxal phosphate-dependent enzyme [Saprospiraceae bacterium]|nr:aminotransferase class I/II-fold pyridoxal phosphate-dependent enzyme [Saprospiraceae bacterium]
MKFETLAIRTQTPSTPQREHSTPMFPTSSFIFDDAEQMRAMFADEQSGNIYSRFTNPNCKELEDKMAALEQTDDAVATASGMSAVFASFMAFLKAGDHLISTRGVFGSTHTIFTQFFPNWNIDVSLVDPVDQDTWQHALKPSTKMFFIETPSNPGLDIIDLQAAKSFCEKNNLILNVDNCFATPYLQQPAQWGADLITHSATKYIDGQGRVLGGIVAGRKDLIVEVKKLCRSTGPALSPFNAWLLSKSLETLAVRMDRHCDNASKLADFLFQHPQVSKVTYPFLEGHPGFDVAKRQMKRGGGLITFEITGGLSAGKRFLDGLQMLSLTANLGDTRSIATHPASTTHAKLTEEARASVGINSSLIRISTGLEHIDDIIADVDNALNISAKA